MPPLEGKVLVAQGGGPTAVINQSLMGVVLESRRLSISSGLRKKESEKTSSPGRPQKKDNIITRIYGALHGIEGIVDEEFLDLTEATTHNLEAVAQTPSSALLSTRNKPDQAYCHEIFRVCQAHEIRYFFYIGGRDSAKTCQIVQKEAEKAMYDMRIIHIPKSIDNNVDVTNHSPGYGSAAKFVAQAFAGVNLDNRAIPGVYVGVTMGRHAGFLTAASLLLKKYPGDGPHLIYVPERPFTRDQFISDVKEAYEKFGRCIVAVSEGIVDKNGVPIVAPYIEDSLDPYGNMPLSGNGRLANLLTNWIKQDLKDIRVRGNTLGYLQRSFLGCVSDVDMYEAREVGEKAVQYAIWHNEDGSVCIERTGEYAAECFLAPLEDVAGATIQMPDEFINKEGNGVTDPFKYYARPLIGKTQEVWIISAKKVDKILH